MSKMEKRLNRLKRRYDLNSQLLAKSETHKPFLLNLTRNSLSKGVELNLVREFSFADWLRLQST